KLRRGAAPCGAAGRPDKRSRMLVPFLNSGPIGQSARERVCDGKVALILALRSKTFLRRNVGRRVGASRLPLRRQALLAHGIIYPQLLNRRGDRRLLVRGPRQPSCG